MIEMDAASNRGIDDIRDLRDKVHFAPVEGRVKVYIIDEVHMLTPEAFNALLKTLEEPPPTPSSSWPLPNPTKYRPLSCPAASVLISAARRWEKWSAYWLGWLRKKTSK